MKEFKASVFLCVAILAMFFAVGNVALADYGIEKEATCVLWGIASGKVYEVDYVNNLIGRCKSANINGFFADVLEKYLKFGRPRMMIDPFSRDFEWPPRDCRH